MNLTNDDLQAIGNLIDQKLDKRISPIDKRLSSIEKDVKSIKEDTTSIIDALDKELMHQAKRVDRIERKLELPPYSD
jgi:predicted RNase H-like nuclease (RuvC/YqgF family)